MEFKTGSGWRCCYDPETGVYTAEIGGGPNHDLYEITKEIYDHIDDPGAEWPEGMIHKGGRHLYMTVNDRCGPPYTVILDSDYKRLCPWAKTIVTGEVWDEDMTDEAVAAFASEADNRAQRRAKKAERERKMEKKESIEKLVREAHEKGGFTGTWLYAEKGEIISKGAIGVNDPEKGTPMTEDMVFDLASVTKQFTASAVMLLKRMGLLSLDDEIIKFFPEVPFPGVTVRHLLNHTGGLPDYEDWIENTARAEGNIPGNEIMIRFLCESGEEAEFAPGEKWEYSNTGYCVLAEIIERVSGMPYEDFLEKNIFVPAGMTATKVYHRRKDNITVPNLALGMVYEDGRYILPDDSPYPDNNDVVPLDGVNGDGLVHSNIFDLFRWDRVLREGSIVTLEEQAEMYTPTVLNNGEYGVDDDLIGPSRYGYGWDIMNDPEHGLIVAHSGGWPGYALWFERFIDEDKVIIKLSCRDALDARAMKELVPGLHAIARGGEPEPVMAIEEIEEKDPDKSGREALCGKYEKPDDDLYVDEVFMKEGELFARFMTDTGRSWEWKLFPLGSNEFGVKYWYSVTFKFEEGGISYGGYTCKKL